MPAEVEAPPRVLWSAGDTRTLRHVLRGRTWCALPVSVLDDSHEATVVRISAGTRWLAAVGPHDGRRAHTWVDDWTLAPAVWTGDDCTYVFRPGRWCATGWFAPADGSRPGRYYINAQQPVRWVAGGVETLDLELDVELYSPDLVPVWKDRDRFARAMLAGVLSDREAELVEADVEAAVRAVQDGEDAELLRRLSAVVVQPATLDPSDVARLTRGAW